MTYKTISPDWRLVAKHGIAEIYATKEFKFVVFYNFKPDKMRFFGQKVSAMNCYKSADLCEQHLSRPHLTCGTCPLRQIIVGKLPMINKIDIHQVWCLSEQKKFSRFLFKNLLSVSESAGWIK